MKPPRIFDRLWKAYLGFSAHDGSLVAAAIAYYVALSFYPLMMVLVAGVGYALYGTVDGRKAIQDIHAVVSQQTSPALADQVQRAFDHATANANAGFTIGFLVLVVTAVAIFAQVDYAFDRIWNLGVERQETWSQWLARLLLTRFKALAMLIGVGAFLLAVMIASVVWSGVQRALATANVEPTLSWAAGLGINVALNFVALTFVYKYVPKPTIRWREALAGGMVAAPLWEIGRQVLAKYLLGLNYPTAYGIIGSFLAIMLWAYYAMLIVLFGAEYVRVRQRERVEGKDLGF